MDEIKLSERIRNMPDGATLSQTQALADEVAQLEAEVERLLNEKGELANENAYNDSRANNAEREVERLRYLLNAGFTIINMGGHLGEQWLQEVADALKSGE